MIGVLIWSAAMHLTSLESALVSIWEYQLTHHAVNEMHTVYAYQHMFELLPKKHLLTMYQHLLEAVVAAATEGGTDKKANKKPKKK